MVISTTDFDMIDVVSYYFPELYRECTVDKDDVQILFGSGHFLGIFYDSKNKTVYVYDSQYQRQLYERQIEIINFRYPKRKNLLFIKPMVRQVDTDFTSCGPFAIAYVTTIILGNDPAEYYLKTDANGVDRSRFLRMHIKRMFENESLEHFPQENIDF